MSNLGLWRVKDSSVSFVGVVPQVFAAISLGACVWCKYGANELVVTSANDGNHSIASLHYDGRAVDFRTKNLPVDERMHVIVELSERLGADYDVVFEDEGLNNEHCHVEWQPKRRM